MEAMNDTLQGGGASLDPQNLQQSSQGEQSGYDSVREGQGESGSNMGGGYGVHGSGVAGGYEGNSQQQNQATGTGEKQDWLDKGITMGAKKLGINVSEQNADKAGDFANKGFGKYEGRNLPGVQ